MLLSNNFIRKRARPRLTANIWKVSRRAIFANSFRYASTTTDILIRNIAPPSVLGILWNKEKLQTHQVVGMVLTITAAVALAVVSV